MTCVTVLLRSNSSGVRGSTQTHPVRIWSSWTSTLPKRDGREVLADIKQDADLRTIPVVVLTSSDAEADIAKTYDLGANCYIKKPVNLQEFQHIVASIEGFWFTIVKLPKERDAGW